MDSKFSEQLARSGFAHRATESSDGSVVYRLADRSGSVRVPIQVWNRLGEEFETALAPSRKRTRWLSIALFPAILIFGMTVAGYIPFGGVLILIGIFLGPIAIYLMHSRDVQTVTRSIEERLKSYPRCPAAQPDAIRFPRVLEIAFMVLVGPHLLLAIIGQIGGPDTFRGTPLSGIGIGAFQMLALGLIAIRLLWPRIAPMLTGSR